MYLISISQINQTRFQWGFDYRCPPQPSIDPVAISVTAFIILSTLAFYLLTAYLSPLKAFELRARKSFHQSLEMAPRFNTMPSSSARPNKYSRMKEDAPDTDYRDRAQTVQW